LLNVQTIRAAILLFAIGTAAHATNITWTGAAGDNLYNTPGNWACGGCGAFPNNSGPNTYSVTIDPAGVDVTNLNVLAVISSIAVGANSTFNFQTGKSLTVSSASGGTISNLGQINLNAASLVLDSASTPATFTLTGYGALNLSDSSANSISGKTGSEALVNDTGHTIQGAGQISGFSSFTNNGTLSATSTSGNALVVNGLSNWNGAGTLSNGTYNASGTLKLTGVGPVTTLNGATVNVSGSGLITGNGSTNALGTLASIAGSSLSLTDTTGFAGIAAAGGTLALSSAGSLSLSGATLAVTGAVSQTGGSSTSLTGSTLNVSAALTQDSTSTLTLAGSQLTSGSLNNAGSVSIDSASILNAGTLTNLSAGTLGGGGSYAIGGTLNYNGNSGIANIAAGTTLDLNAAGAAVNYVNGSGAHNALAQMQGNAGTFTVEGGASVSSTGNFTNTGSVNVDNGGALTVAGAFTNAAAGTLNVGPTSPATFGSQGFTNNGSLTVGIGSTADVRGGAFGNLTGSTLAGGTYAIAGTLQYTGAGIQTIASGTSLNVSGQILATSGANALGGLKTVNGSLTVSGGNSLSVAPASGVLTVGAGGTLTVTDSSLTAPGFTNNGTFVLGGAATADFTGGTFTNLQSGSLKGGVFDIAGAMTFDGGGISDISSTGNLTLRGPNASLQSGGNDALATLTSNEGSLTLVERASQNTNGDFANAGTLTVSGPGDALSVAGQFTNTGTVAIGSGGVLTSGGNYLQNGGSTAVNGMISAPEVDVNGGVLSGTGEITGLLVNNGTVNPGGQSGVQGTLSLDNGYTQEAAGKLVLEFSGSDPSLYDNLSVIGDVHLSGMLSIELDGGYVPTLGEVFQIVNFTGALSGNFTSFDLGSFGPGYTFQEIIDANDISLQVVQGTSTVPEPGTWVSIAIGIAAIGSLRRKSLRRKTLRRKSWQK
jgi:hypothetical protein